MGWILDHLTGGIGSAVLGVLGHFGTQAVGFFRDRQNIQSLKDLAGIKAAASVQSASYQAVQDWIHPVIAVMLFGVYVGAAWQDAPDDLVDHLAQWTGFAVGWLFGRLGTNTYRRK